MPSNAHTFHALDYWQHRLATMSAPFTPLREYDVPDVDLTRLLASVERKVLQRKGAR